MKDYLTHTSFDSTEIQNLLDRLSGLIEDSDLVALKASDLTLSKEPALEKALGCCLKLAEEKLIWQQQFEHLTKNLAAWVVIEDEAQIVYSSPYSQVLTGLNPTDIQGCLIDELWKSLVDEEYLPLIRRFREMALVGSDVRLEFPLQNVVGGCNWVEAVIAPMYNAEHDEIQGLMWLCYDVSRFVSVRKTLEERNQDLSDFVYMISHDLKAPIYSIKGLAQFLKQNSQGNISEMNLDILNDITDSANLLEKLISSIIQYSNLSHQKGELEIIDLNDLLEDVIRDLQGQIGDLGAKITISPNLPQLRGERLRIYQVFSNLISNALKYSDSARPPEVTIGAEMSERQTKIIVRDNGLGIPKECLGLIFKPFKRVHHAKAEGSGIGLACVDKIVRKLGGSIHVESEEGVGSSFIITVPSFHSPVNI